MIEQLQEQIKVVALHRSIAKSNSDILQMDREAWEKENKEQIDLVALTRQHVIEAEDILKSQYLNFYHYQSPAVLLGGLFLYHSIDKNNT